MILGEIRRFLRDDSPVKVSRSIKETAYKVNRIREDLAKDLGRDPTINEIAEALAIPREEVVNALEATATPESIYNTVYQDDGDPIYIIDQLSGDNADEEPWLEKIAMKSLLMKLPEKHRRVLALRFFHEQTQAQVASQMNLSQVQISRIERKALAKLRELMQAEGGAKNYTSPPAGGIIASR